MAQDSIRERQDNEVEVLQAVFMGEMRDLRQQDVWKVWRPTELVIPLNPQQGDSTAGVPASSSYVSLDLHVKCASDYPDSVPDMELENSKGLSSSQLAALHSELMALADSLKGEVMILELAQHVQRFLHRHNKPESGSFYDEMLSRKLQEEQEVVQKQQEQLQLRNEKERQAIQDEIQRKQDALKEELRRRKEQYSKSSISNSATGGNSEEQTLTRMHSYSTSSNSRRERFHSAHSESSDGSGCCEHQGIISMQFEHGQRRVQRGKCLGHSSRGISVVYAGMDMGTGQLVAIVEWQLKCSLAGKKTAKDAEMSPLIKQVYQMEHELQTLRKLQHPNLVHYLDLKHVRKSDQVTVHLLQEYMHGCPLSLYISEGLALESDTVRHIARGILQGLAYLHHKDIFHENLQDSSVFLERGGRVCVSDYGFVRRLSDLCISRDEVPPCVRGIRHDLKSFGRLMLSLTQGEPVGDDVIPPSFPVSLKDFLEKCLDNEGNSMWIADQLLEHSFLQTAVEKPLAVVGMPMEADLACEKLEGNAINPLFLTAACPKGQSRIQTEFEILTWLGRGSFGDVVKVRNKLDSGIYAIKRIHLNPKNRQLNRKITREVKLLSRLNHENVVRYYNAWVETLVREPQCSFLSNSTLSEHKESGVNVSCDFDDVEKLAPPVKDGPTDWSISYEAKSSALISGQGVSSDDSSDDNEWLGTSYLPSSESSDSVVFERDGEEDAQEGDAIIVNQSSTSTVAKQPTEIQYMYIQMEFCEKSTLRNAIDNQLWQDSNRVWRLFREIIEGLLHIHQQGMIHRDLKPVNIFLDSNDHVKIGDFGLATTNMLPMAAAAQVGNVDDSLHNSKLDGKLSSEELTGQVGTALYVAPELVGSGVEVAYNQKVDIYSLGIIFFEMCYRTPSTGMERVQVLVDLRKRDPQFPADFEQVATSRHANVICWILSYDPVQRPTSLELLRSEHVPPPQLEDAELQEMVRHTLSNPQSKAYKYLVASCFEQDSSAAEDVTYDMDNPKSTVNPKVLCLQEKVKEMVVLVFQRHGALQVSTGLFMPKNMVYEQTESCVRLMTHGGNVVSVPHDLHAPFARFVVWNNLSAIRRYCVDKVYREKKVFGSHPRELYECAFDIVSPSSGNLMADAELLTILWEIVNEIPGLKDKSYIIRLNHTGLIKALLLHCGIEEEKHDQVYSILSDAKAEKHSKFQIQTHLISLCLPERAVSSLYSYIEKDSSMTEITSTLRNLTRRQGRAAILAKEGLKDLKRIISHAEAFGVKCPIVVAPGLVYNLHHYSGMVCQMVCNLKRKKKKAGPDVLAAGGRYDNVVAGFRKMVAGLSPKEVTQSAVGISISLDKIVSVLREEENTLSPPAAELVVCSLGQSSLTKEKASLARELWACGLRAVLLDVVLSLDEVQDSCREMGCMHLLLLKDGELGTVRIRSWEKDRFQEKKIAVTEAVDYILKQLRPSGDVSDAWGTNNSSSRAEAIRASGDASLPSPRVVCSIFTNSKLSAKERRRYENQIISHVTPSLQHFSPRVVIEVMGLDLGSPVMKTLASHLELDTIQDFWSGATEVMEKHPRYRKYLSKICDKICELRFEKECPVIILYSLPDNMHRILL